MVKQSSNPIVEAVGLTKVFRDFWMRTKALAVDHIDFEINPGEIFGLLGPNGSGKSTTIKMILGLLHKTSGQLTVFGRTPSDVTVKKHIGFLPEESYLYRYLNPQETLDYYGRLFGLDRATRRRRIEELLEMVGLSHVAHRPIGEFSKGMARRIGIAQALINDPEFLILDEPTSGLDPIGTKQVKDLLLNLRSRNKTILLSSHLLSDVQDVCDRMVMLYGGTIRAEGSVDQLLEDTGRTIIQSPRLKAETIERVEAVIRESEGIAIEKVSQPRQRLEDLFLDIVEQARREQVETAGATESGQTAGFLRAQGEGDELIESLTSDALDAPPVRATEVKEASREEVQRVTTDKVVEGLTSAAPEPETKATEVSRKVERPRVDQSMIDDLIDGVGSSDDEDEPGE
ncbi:MAG: ABC transporter ATP-binding protein [Planctomycetota bacterium]|nr:ABC transporter ATP-binding protein [Planctomycetota bacterium]